MKYNLCLLSIILSFLISTTAKATFSSYDTDFIFTHHGAPMLIIDSSTGNILDVNPSAEKFYEYSVHELKTMNISQINILPIDKITAEMATAVAQERNYFVFKHKLKDGSIRDVEVYSSPATDEEGNQILMSIVHDITPQVIAQKEAFQNKIITIALMFVIIIGLIINNLYINQLRRKELESKKNYQNLFNHMNEGFALHEIICNEKGVPVDYRFLEVNPAFEALTGLQAEHIEDRTVKEVLPNTEQSWIDKYGEVALHNKSFTFEDYSKELNKYFRVSSFSPNLNQFVTIITDITEHVQFQEKIEFERNLLETILEDAMSGYWNWNLIKKEKYLSPSFKAMFGYEDHELQNSPQTWRKLIFEEDIPLVLDCYRKHVDSHGAIPYYYEARYKHKNGSTVWIICSGRVVEWDGDTAVRMVGCHINVTKLKKLEAELYAERNLFKTTLHSLGDGVISTDKNGNVDLMNAVAEQLTGWMNKDAKGLPFETVFRLVNEYTGKQFPNPVKRVFETAEIIELANHTMLIKKSGDSIPIEDSAAPIKDEQGNITGVVLVFRDFTDKKEKQEKIRYLSHHDQLTTLFNRHFFEEQLSLLDIEDNLPFTIVMADVNGLKLTNDAFGHKAGDQLLTTVATILKKECRSTDIVARVGGDEFVILLPRTTSCETEKMINRVHSSINKETNENVIISVSFGWETKVTPEQSIHEILSKAEEHMYRKKLVESQSMRNQTIKVIMHTLHETNMRERVHSEKVSQISRTIGEAMKLDSDTLKELEIAALMHDIGKIAISPEVLNKAGKLTDTEYEDLKRHSEIGYHILKSVDVYTNLADYVLSHHERWDGTGYPRGLAGETIPLVGRIIAVADAFEAMIGDRPYRSSMNPIEALEEIKRCSGTQYDPNIVEIFCSMQLSN